MERRTFLQAGAVGLLATALGCDPDDRKNLGAGMSKMAPMVLDLPIDSDCAAVLSLLMTVVGGLLKWDLLWQDDTESRQIEHQVYTLNQHQRMSLSNGTPVIIRNQQGENLNDKVLLSDWGTLVLANQWSQFAMSYRCPGLCAKRGPLSTAPQFASEMDMLRIPCQYWNLGYGVAEVRYGNAPYWQSLYTPWQQQVEWWQFNLLRTGGFEAMVQPA